MKAVQIAFRAVVTLHVTLLLIQPVLIGLYLSGGDEARLNAHEIVGSAVGATGIFALLASVLAWRIAKWPATAVMWCALLLVAEIVQLSLGYQRHLGLHVPLGVFLAIRGIVPRPVGVQAPWPGYHGVRGPAVRRQGSRCRRAVMNPPDHSVRFCSALGPAPVARRRREVRRGWARPGRRRP